MADTDRELLLRFVNALRSLHFMKEGYIDLNGQGWGELERAFCDAESRFYTHPERVEEIDPSTFHYAEDADGLLWGRVYSPSGEMIVEYTRPTHG